MKQTRFIFLTVLCFLAACTKVQEMEPGQNSDNPQGEVEVTFRVEMPGDLIPTTKALTDTPALDNMYVAVFGSSGYLKEYRQATLVSSATTNYWTPGPGETEEDRPDNTTSDTFQYKVTLSLSENSRRILHFIANAPTELPFDQATTILPELLSTEGEAAYWQTVTLTGIKAKRDTDGDFIDAQGHKITGQDPNQRYVVSDETKAALDGIALIRNFAKIEVYNQDDSNFELISFAAINVPTSGSIVPYYAGGFVQGYQNNSYEQLRTLGYPGFLPLHAEFNDDIPAKNDFVNRTSAVASTGQAYYLYERPIPNDRQGPTFVIIYGKYTDPEDHTESLGFYRVDLMEGQEYYPIYRNFKYKISIKKILKPGASTPAEAAVTAGSADVSADVATANLNDISDGMSRIVVSYMSKTLTKQYGNDNKLELQFKFYPDVKDFANASDPEPKHDNSKVTVTRETENGPIISSISVAESDDPDTGYRSVWITTSAPSDAIKTERIKVEGTVIDEDNHQRKLYRYITYSMISTQTMYVHCSPKRVQKEVGESVDVDITIPSGLPESIFPLIFQIEAASLSLTPDTEASNNNLPVISSTTTVPGGSGLSFHFERSLSYSEYLDLPAVSGETAYALPNGVSWDGLVTLTCHFKTNKKLNGSQVYVSEKAGYFHQANDGFSNYGVKAFTNLAFSYGTPAQSGVPTAQGEAVTFSFDIGVDAGDGLPNPVYVELVRLRPTQGSGLTAVPGRPGVYSFTPTDSHCNLQLYTSEAGSVVSAKLTAEEYNEASLSTPKLTFQDAAITNKVMYGIGKQAVFQYTYENDALLPIIVTLSGLEPVSTDNRFADNGNGTWTFTPRGGNATTQSFTLLTTTQNGDVSVHIANALYNEYPTVNKGREYWTLTSPALSEVALGDNVQVDVSFSYDSSDTEHNPVTFNLGSSYLTTSDSRMVNNGNGSWTFTPNDSNAQQTITFTTTTFARGGSLRITPTDGSYNNGYVDNSYSRPTSIVIPADYLSLTGGQSGSSWLGWISSTSDINVYSDKSCSTSISNGFTFNDNGRNNSEITITINSNYTASTPAYLKFTHRTLFWTTAYYSSTTIGNLLNASKAQDAETLTFTTNAP